MEGNDIKDLIDELLTCRICEGIGCRKDTALLLFPKCQHYFCEKCVTTMRKQKEAENKAFIDCPCCREEHSVTDEDSTPSFRYAERLAEKVLSRSQKRRGRSINASKSKPKSGPVLLKTLNASRQQIVRFMQFGFGSNLYTSAGALSSDFGNTGLYLIKFGDNEVKRFGEAGDRYDGLAFMGPILYAVNHTKWRLEMYQTFDIDSKWPKLKQWQAVSLEKDNARESSEVSLAIIPYQNELHFMWGDRHLCRCNDITKILIPGLDKTKKKTMIAADNKCLWYMDGDDLSELTISDGQKKTVRL